MEGLRQLRGVWNQAPHLQSCWPLRLPLRARSPPAPARPRHFFTDDEQLLTSRPLSAGQEASACGSRTFPGCCCFPQRWLHGIACDPLLTTRLAIMGMLAILLIVMTILTWYFTSTHAQRSVSAVAASLRHELLTHAQQATHAVFRDNNASTVSVARLLSFTAADYTSFSTLDTQVRSALFTVYAALPRRRTVSFYGRNGMFISYTFNFNSSSLFFSNTSYLNLQSNQSSIPWNPQENITATRPWYRAYHQPIDSINGSPIGDPTSFPAVPFWGRTSFNVSLNAQPGASSWGFVLQPPGYLSFQTCSPVRLASSADAAGVAGIGVAMSEVHDLLAGLDLQGGDIYLTDDACRLVAQTRHPADIGVGQLGTPLLPLASASNNSVVAGAARYLEAKTPDCSVLSRDDFQGGNAVIDGTRYLINAAPLHLAEITLVCVIVIPYKSIWGSSDRRSNATLAVLVVLAACAGLVGCFFVVLLTKGVSNEMRLRAQLLQQHEARKEAETKSSQKSIVFASMSHDLRTPLAAIIGLIDICLCDVGESTELESNLLQMKSCAENLLGILNSVLDMSKIEAGKLHLIEKDFDIVHALEEVVDMFAVVGMKKGLEVVLDLPDDSIESLLRVRGDEGRVKQLLSNLLSNGVKFTSEGHVVVRAWPKHSSSMAAVHTFRHIDGIMGSIIYPFRRWFHGRRKSYQQMRAMYERYAASNKVEFEFEVDDTGKGIPRDRRKAVFDNFVQVDTSTPQTNGGTGLGLGIVRSLVRLMGGDIAIVDKAEPGEAGTCFRFNLVFSRVAELLDSEEVHGMRSYQSKETRLPDRVSVQETFGSSGRAAIPLWSFRSSSGRRVPSTLLNDPYATPPLVEGVNVVLAMQGIAGKRVVRRWMERRGLQVSVVNIWEDFLPTLERIRREIFYDESLNGFSERFEIASPGIHSLDSWAEEMEARRRSKDWTSVAESGLSQEVLESEAGRTTFPKYVDRSGARLLILIDADMILEPLSSVATILQGGLTREDQHALSRVVWLVTTNTPSHVVQSLKDGNAVPCDLCLHKPLHGSRLLTIWELVQKLTDKSEPKSYETGGGGFFLRTIQGLDHRGNVGNILSAASQVRLEPQFTQNELNSLVQEGTPTAGENAVVDIYGSESAAEHTGRFINGETSGVASSKTSCQGNSEGSVPEVPVVTKVQSQAADLEALVSKSRLRENEMMGPPDALARKLILVAEDNKVLQKLTKTILIKMGATVECVDDGAEAVRRVVSNLPRPSSIGPLHDLQEVAVGGQSSDIGEEASIRPYDMVFMDCQMPVLDGYEATIQIREEEKAVGWRTPVIALTAHAMAQDERKCINAGMDFYLTKPLSTKALLDVVSKVNVAAWNRGNAD